MWLRIVVAGVVVVLAGCSSAVGGQPTAAPGTDIGQSTSPSRPGGSPPPPSADNTYGAPRVSNPLDASRFLTRPCDVLTPTQLKTFGVVKPGRPDTESEIAKRAGPGCAWHAEPEVSSTIGVGFLTGNKNGLSDTYRGRGQFKFFEETTPVDGYPAVFNDLSDRRANGSCNITVGISDTLTFIANEQGRLKGQTACDRAKQVAAAVIVTLKESA